MNGDRRKALIWHRLETGLVLTLALVAVVGLVWSEGRNRPRFTETRPR